MKHIKPLTAIALALFLSGAAMGQDLKINEITEKYAVEGAVSFESLKKDTLFKRSYKWLYKRFPQTGEKGTYINADKSKIRAEEYFTPGPESPQTLTNLRIGFIMNCEFRDNKMKYSVSDFYYVSTGEGKVTFESEKFKKYDVADRDALMKLTAGYVQNLITDMTGALQKARK
jgi:hypothetical protein